MAPVEGLGEKPDTRDELAALQASRFIVYADRQHVRQIEPSLEPGELFAWLGEQWIGPELSPNQRVSAIHVASLSETN